MLIKFLLIFVFIFNASADVCLKDVRESLSNISSKGIPDVFSTQDFMKSKEYTKSIRNIFGFNNHFQGLVYHPSTQVYYLSGGDFKNKKSMLLSLKNEDQEIKAFQRLELKNEFDHWHLGGINIFENVLIAPFEKMGLNNDDSSVIQLLDISDPHDIKVLENSFSRIGINYGSADIMKSHDGYYLVAGNSGQLDVFFSRDLYGEFQFVKTIKEKVFKASYIKLFSECNGKTYIANFSPKGFLSSGKKNILQLFELDIEESHVEKLEKYTFHCDKKCSFRGAVGVHQINQKLEVVSSKQNKEKENKIKFQHFK